MRTLSLGRYALSVCATAILLAACGWQSPTSASFSAATRTGQAGPAEVPARRPTEAELGNVGARLIQRDPGSGARVPKGYIPRKTVAGDSMRKGPEPLGLC